MECLVVGGVMSDSDMMFDARIRGRLGLGPEDIIEVFSDEEDLGGACDTCTFWVEFILVVVNGRLVFDTLGVDTFRPALEVLNDWLNEGG